MTTPLRFVFLAGILAVAVVLAMPAQGQALAPVWQTPSPPGNNDDFFGERLAPAGDLDGDGVTDLLVGAPRVTATGRVYVLNGRTGRVLRTIAAPAGATFFFGQAIASLGDVTGDGTPDLLATSYATIGGDTRAGAAYVFSGSDGALVRTVVSPNAQALGFFGFSVAAAGDLDGDGVPDFTVGATDEDVAQGGTVRTDQGVLYAFSGADGSLLWQTTPDPADGIFFGRVAALRADASNGDATGDGVPDLVASAVLAQVGGAAAGRAYLVSGADGAIVYEVTSASGRNGGFFGQTLLGTGDLDGDGRADFAVGAPFETADGLASAGTVHVFSGASGTRLAAVNAARFQQQAFFTASDFGQFLGTSLALVGDLSGDGVPELAAGAITQYNGPRSAPTPIGHRYTGGVFVFDGAALAQGDTDAVFAEVAPFFPSAPVQPRIRYGTALAALGDLDGDGLPDLAASAPENGINIGYVNTLAGSTLRAVSALAEAASATAVVQNDAVTVDFAGTGVAIAFDVENPFDRQLPMVTYTLRRFSDGPALVRGEAIVNEPAIAPVRWTLTKDAIHERPVGKTYRIRLADLPDGTIADPQAVLGYFRTSIGGEFQPQPTTFDAGAGTLVVEGRTEVGELVLAGAGVAVAAGDDEVSLPARLSVSAYPNPVAQAATVVVAVPEVAAVRVEVVDMLGRRVALLHDAPLAAGSHPFALDAARLVPGLYVVRAATPRGIAVRSLSIVR